MAQAHETHFGRFVLHAPHREAGKWRFRFRDLGTGRVRKFSTGATNKRLAKQKALEHLRFLAEGVTGAADSTLADAFDSFIASREIRDSTRREYEFDKRVACRFLGEDTPVSSITPADVQGFLNSRKDRAPATRRRQLVMLRAVFKHLTVLGELTTNPAEGFQVRVPRDRNKRRALSAEEARALVAATRARAEVSVAAAGQRGRRPGSWRQTGPDRRHLELFVRLALQTGLRMGNILTLTWDRVDLDGRRISIPGSEMKAGQSHSIPIHRELLSDLREEQGRHTYVIGASIATSPKRGIQACADEAGIGNLRIHELRHTYASWLEPITPFPTLRRLLAHSPGTVTETYTHQPWEQLVEAIDRLPALLP